MSTFFVTRHPGARAWAKEQGFTVDTMHFIENFAPDMVNDGDMVIGTLPVHLIAQVCRKGARYQHLSMEIPPELRGMELDLAQMAACNARLEEYDVALTGLNGPSRTAFNQENHIQFCLASDQNEANYLTAAELRPKKVYIFCSAAQRIQNSAMNLQSALKAINIQSEIIPNFPETDLETLRSFFARQFQRVRDENPGAHCLLNATGGRKDMSFVCSQVFSVSENTTVVYLDSQSQKIQVLFPWAAPSLELKHSLMTIESAMTLRGFEVKSRTTDNQEWQVRVIDRANLTSWLAQKACQFTGFLSALNFTASKAKQQSGFMPFELKNKPYNVRARDEEVLGRFVEEKLIEWDSENKAIRFINNDTREYLNGFWLEEFTWLVLRKFGEADYGSGIEVQHCQQKNIKNEIDFALTRSNRLLLVECKTKNLKNSLDVGNQELYRIDSLQKQLGGSAATSFLISVTSLNPDIEQRARQNRTVVISGPAIVGLKDAATLWKDGSSAETIQNMLDTKYPAFKNR